MFSWQRLSYALVVVAVFCGGWAMGARAYSEDAAFLERRIARLTAQNEAVRRDFEAQQAHYLELRSNSGRLEEEVVQLRRKWQEVVSLLEKADTSGKARE